MKICNRLSSSEVQFYTENGRIAFLSPLWGLGATYEDHLRLIGKRVVDFLLGLVLTELFSLGVTVVTIFAKQRISVEIGDFAPTGAG